MQNITEDSNSQSYEVSTIREGKHLQLGEGWCRVLQNNRFYVARILCLFTLANLLPTVPEPSCSVG